MRYRTVIEITTDEFDKDSAIFAAGEYLKGNLGYDVISMRSKTTALSHYRFRTISVMGLIIFTLISVLLLKSSTVGSVDNVCPFGMNIEKTVCYTR